MQRRILTSLAGFVMACALLSAHAAGESDSLAAARALWRTAAPQSYSYVVEEHAGRAFGICKGSD